MNKGGFSWKRAVGITRFISSISRSTGIPLTKSGRQRKIGKIATGGGCLVLIIVGGDYSILCFVLSNLIESMSLFASFTGLPARYATG
jgi:hypothetical protein